MATVTDGTPFFLLGIFGTWLFSAVDATRTAQLIRSGLAPDAESDAITRRLYGNPLAWAVTMITLGAVFLLHTVFGVRLPIEKSLPLLLVLLGAYMLFDFLRARRRRETPNFDAVPRPPSVVGGGPASAAFPGDATRFGTGELITQVSSRPTSMWPTDPRA
jgi:hypothetical protein